MDLSDVDFTKILNTPQPKDINLDDIDWNAALGVPKAVDIASPNMMANPEQAAKAMKIAPDAGTTPVIANSNMKLAMEQAQRTKAARAINDSPALQQWIEQSDNPLVTAISNDDYEKLGDFAKAMTRIGGTAPPGHRFGEETVQRGTEAFEAQGPYAHAAASFALGDVSKEAQLREYEAKPKLPPADMIDLPGHVAGLLGGLAANFAYGGSKGAIVGGLLGTVGGPAGVAAGASIGAHAGTLLDMALGSYGIAARNANQWRDSRGEPMGELSQQAVAIGSGALTAVVAGAAGPYAARAFSGAVTPLLMRAFGEKAVETSLSKAATNLAQAGVTGGALNVGLELAQTVPFEVARAMGSDPHSLISDPTRFIEYAQNLGKAFVNGAVLFAGLAGLPIGANYYMDRARIRQTVSDAQARQEAFDHAVGSLTRERSPETFSEFVRFTGGEDTAIKAATVAKLRETDPTAFDYVPDVDRKIAEALPHDGDLVVPTHEYFARTGEDHHAAVAANIRSGTGLTLNEAKALEEHWVAYHGSAAKFDKFDAKFRRTGEVTNDEGSGHYVAENYETGQSYLRQFSQEKLSINGKQIEEIHNFEKQTPEQQAALEMHRQQQYGAPPEAARKLALENLKDLLQFWDNPKQRAKIQAAVDLLASDKPIPRVEVTSTGNFYQVRVKADRNRMLHWNKGFAEQTPEVQAALRALGIDEKPFKLKKNDTYDALPYGADIYHRLARERQKEFDPNNPEDARWHEEGREGTSPMKFRAQDQASADLAAQGVHGIIYEDSGTRYGKEMGRGYLDDIKAYKSNIVELEKQLNDPETGSGWHAQIREDIAFYKKEIESLEKAIEQGKNPTHNLVIFDDNHLEITHVNGEPIPKAVAESPIGPPLVRDIVETAEKAKKALWLDPIIVPEAAGLSKAAFKRYSNHIQEAQRAATKAAFEIATKEIKRRETPLWRDTMAKIGEEVANEFEQRPDFAAERILRGKGAGEFGDFKTKFNQADVDEMFSSAEQDAMGASPHSLLRPDLITKEESIHPDIMSGLSGHGSGKELISELINLERDRRARGETPMQQYRRAVREETARRMEERHGRLDENIMREAMDLALSVEQIKVLHDDMQKIIDSGGLAAKLDREAVIRDVQDSISKMPATEAAKTRQFELQTAIAGGKAEAAGLKGDWAEAFQHKQVQFRNFLMARESKRIARDVAATERLLGQMGDLTKDSWDQEILDGAHALLKELGLTPPRSTENLLQALRDQSPDVRNYDTFVSHQKEAKGIDILPMPDNFPENYKEATASQIGYLRQVLESVAFHARDQQKISLGEQQEAFHGVMDAIYTNMADMRTKWTPDDLSGWQDWKTAGRNIDALLIRMEQLAAWFDKNDPLGPFTTAVIRPLKAGQHGKDAMLRSLADDFSKLPTSDKWSKSLQEKVTNTVLLDTNGDPLRMTRGRLVAMILNMGNEQNMRTLVEGRNWDEGTVREFVRANAKKEDYEFAQGVWNMLDKYWEDVAEAGRKNTGVRPERVVPQALDTPFGRYAGGYYPLFRERTWEPITKLENMYARGDVNPSVYQASAMRARTGAIYPVELSLDRLPGNLRNLAHTVHYTEPVRNAYKVLSDPEFRNLVTEKFGPEYKDLFYPWLKDIAQDGGTPDSRGEAWYNNISGIARANSVYMLMGWRPSTALIHGGAALSNSVYEVGPRGLASAAKDLFLSTPEDILGAADSMFRNPQQHQSIWTWAMEQSGELRNRNHNLDMDIRREQDKALMGKTDWRALNAYHASWMVSTLDILSAVPTWVAEYKAQRLEGRGHDDAVYVADRAVRQAHGSSGLVDQPQIQRMNEATKWFTTFYGYFNHNYNRQRDTGRMIADIPRVFSQEGLAAGFGEVGKAMAQSMAYLLAPAIIHELVRPHAQEDEGWAKWAIRSMALQLASTAPFVRDAAQAYVTGQAPRGGGPMGELLNAVLYRPFKDLADAVNPDKDVSKDVVKHLLEVPGWLVGFPMSRYSAGTWQYIWDKAKGNETGDDMWRLAVDANPNERKQH